MTTARFDNIANIAAAEDWESDPWGTTTGLFFDIASVLDMIYPVDSIESKVLLSEPFSRWQYHRSPYPVLSINEVASRADNFSEGEFSDDYSYGEISLAVAVRDGEISHHDLIYVGDVLAKYANLLRRNGKDY